MIRLLVPLTLAAGALFGSAEPVVEKDAGQAGGLSPLLWATHRGELAQAGQLLEDGADPSAANDYGVTPLALACENGDPAMVRLLLEAGGDPNAARPSGEAPLMTAARQGNPDCVSALIEAGAEVESVDREGQTALMWAAAAGNTAALDRLLEAGADPHRVLPRSGFDALFFAVRQGHRDSALRLLDAGIDVNRAADPKGRNRRFVRRGTSALLLAVENAHYELALDLVAAGADPNDSRSGFAPLHVLSWVRKSVRGDGIDGAPEPEGSGSVSALEFVRALVAAGADVDIRKTGGRSRQGRFHSGGMTPFLFAAQTGDLPLLRVLHELGADPEARNVENGTALLVAAGLGVGAPGEEASRAPDTIATLDFLLELGADIHAVDDNGETIMHAAAYKGSGEVVRFLAGHGAEVERWNRENKWGSTPLRIARGYRPGNFRKIDETIDAFTELMEAAGVEIPPAPDRLERTRKRDKQWGDD